MPKRAADQGSKPFEVRAGVSGLPTFAGMYRSGDPATIPPHKFHLLVNMRRTPGGLITRPGLALEFDTGIQECIDGLTEDAGEQGGALMLYPGAESRPGNGTPNFVPATFRAVFPDSSADYSEFLFALYGPASAVRGNQSPVLAYSTIGGAYTGPTFLSRPFVFRGQAVQFAFVDRSGVDTVALLGINLAQRSGLQASDCWRDTARPNDGITPACPGAAGQPTPPGLNDPPLWPFQHPVGSVGVLTYFDHPFPDTTIAWTPDAASAADDFVVDQILTRQERGDDVLTGTSGVSEVLYFVARQVAGPIRKRRLIRWDGALQTTEAVTIPDDVKPALGEQPYGPYLVAQGVFTSVSDWAAYRNAAGSWTVIGGLMPAQSPGRGLTWGGVGQMIVAVSSTGLDDGIVWCIPQGASRWGSTPNVDVSDASCVLWRVESKGQVVADAVVSGNLCYALSTADPLSGGDAGIAVIFGDFTDPSLFPAFPAVILDPNSLTLGELSLRWIQAVGSRVYVGGNMNAGHQVWDVTEPTSPFLVYSVLDADQLEDSGEGGHQGERYSRGAIASVPSDDDGAEGFQAS